MNRDTVARGLGSCLTVLLVIFACGLLLWFGDWFIDTTASVVDGFRSQETVVVQQEPRVDLTEENKVGEDSAATIITGEDVEEVGDPEVLVSEDDVADVELELEPVDFLDPLTAEALYATEVAKWSQRSESIERSEIYGVDVVPNTSQVVWTGHGTCRFGDEKVRMQYNDDVTTLYIVVFENQSDEVAEWSCEQIPPTGTSWVPYEFGAEVDIFALSVLPLVESNHCGVQCELVVGTRLVALDQGFEWFEERYDLYDLE